MNNNPLPHLTNHRGSNSSSFGRNPTKYPQNKVLQKMSSQNIIGSFGDLWNLQLLLLLLPSKCKNNFNCHLLQLFMGPSKWKSTKRVISVYKGREKISRSYLLLRIFVVQREFLECKMTAPERKMRISTAEEIQEKINILK